MSYTSQHGEDKIIESLFPKDYKGVCVEVGAYDGKRDSNTYYFEKNGWRALCIEPIPEQFEKCKKIRKECVQAAVSNKNSDDLEYTVFSFGDNQSAISGLMSDQRLVDSHAHLITSRNTIHVVSKTLTTILDELKYPTYIDFISIDTENTELDVLKGFDLNKYNVKVLIIENNFNEPFCEEYLKQFGYKKIHRLAVNDFFMKE